MVLVAALAGIGACQGVAPGERGSAESNVQLGTLMHVWYGFDEAGESVGGRGSSHWDSTVLVQPMKGLYASDDPEVIEWQIDQVLEAGITWVLISWSGPAVESLPASYSPNGVHIGTHRATQAVLNYLNGLPGQPMKAAILVENWPDEQALFGDPLPLTDSEKSAIWDSIHDLYQNYEEIWFDWEGKPLVAAWMPMHMGPDDRFTYRLMNVYQDVPLPDDYLMDWNMLDTQDREVFGDLVSEDGFRKVAPRLNWWPLYRIGYRDEPIQIDADLSERWYDLQWEWVFDDRDRIKLLLVWTWNEYHEQNFIEPTITQPSIGVGEVYRDRTRYYVDRLRSGQRFKRQ